MHEAKIKLHQSNCCDCVCPATRTTWLGTEQFYQKLQHEIDGIRTDEEVIMMGDLNGHIGMLREGYEQVVEHHGIGRRNDEGERLLDVFNVNRMKIMNTFFHHRPSHKYTWSGWNNEKQKYDGQTQIYLCLTTNHRFVTNTKAIPSVSLDSDHRLVVMNKKYKYTAVRPAEKKRGFEFKTIETRKKRDYSFSNAWVRGHAMEKETLMDR